MYTWDNVREVVKKATGNDEKARQTKVSQHKQQAECNFEDGRRGLGVSASQGARAWDIENKACNSFSQRRDSTRHLNIEIGKIFGGILRQLIAENDEQLADYRSKLAEYQSKIEKLEQRRLQLRDFYEELQGEASVGEQLPEEE